MEIDDLSEAEDDLSEEDEIVEEPVKGLWDWYSVLERLIYRWICIKLLRFFKDISFLERVLMEYILVAYII